MESTFTPGVSLVFTFCNWKQKTFADIVMWVQLSGSSAETSSDILQKISPYFCDEQSFDLVCKCTKVAAFRKGYCRKLETQHCHFVSHDLSYQLIVVKILFPH